MSNEQKAFDDFFKNIDYNIDDVSQGKLLISEPFLSDPNFSRTVVLLVRHDKEGSLGFVLNQQSQFTINEAISDFPLFDAPLNLGGPVGTESLFYIHTRPDLIEEGLQIIPGLYWGGNFDQVKQAVTNKKISTEHIQFYVGYSGWEAGQLKQELKEKSWIVTNCSQEEVMQLTKDELWTTKMKNLGKKFKIMAGFPADPSLN
jgi:putative transcriptional regulator